MENNELYHHGVKGMRWGIRKDRKKSSSTRSKNESEEKEESNGRVKRLIDKCKQKVTKEKAAKAVAKGAEVAGKLLVASAADDVFYGGMGKKIAKETIKQTGRAAVTAYVMANGGYDIRWYDK